VQLLLVREQKVFHQKEDLWFANPWCPLLMIRFLLQWMLKN